MLKELQISLWSSQKFAIVTCEYLHCICSLLMFLYHTHNFVRFCLFDTFNILRLLFTEVCSAEPWSSDKGHKSYVEKKHLKMKKKAWDDPPFIRIQSSLYSASTALLSHTIFVYGNKIISHWSDILESSFISTLLCSSVILLAGTWYFIAF